MFKEKIINFCDHLMSWIILGIIFFTPLYFNIFTYLCFEIDKLVLFRCLTEILLLVYVCRILISGKILLIKNKYFYISTVLILCSQVIAIIFTDYIHVGIWGSYWRGFGLLTCVHLYVFAFIVFQHIGKSSLKLKKYFYAIAAAGFISSLYGLIQVYGYDFLRWEDLALNIHNRASSTLGQPNYLASYLLLAAPITFYLLISSKKNYQRLLFFVFLSFQFLALLYTNSMAASLGFIAAIFIFGVGYFFNKNKRVLLAFLTAILLCLSFLVYANISGKRFSASSSLALVNRFISLTDIYQGSMASRILYYQAAADIIKNKFWIGYGPDSQGYNFYKYYFPEYAIFEDVNRYPDRAHSEILDILITTGILGLAAWIFFFYVLIKQSFSFLFSAENKQDKKNLVKIILFGLLSFYVSILFGFFTVVSAVYFWFIIALLFSFYSDDRWIVEFKIRRSVALLFALVFVACIFSAIWQANAKIIIANYYYRKMKVSLLINEFSRTFFFANKVLEYAPSEPYYRSQLMTDLLPMILTLDESENKIFALNYLKDSFLNQNINNATFEGRVLFAMVLSEIGREKLSHGESADKILEFSKAESAFSDLADKAPGFSRLYYDWGNLYYYQNKFDQASSKYYESIASYPRLDHPGMGPEHRHLVVDEMKLSYKKIIGIKLAQENYRAAEDLALKALKVDPYDLELRDALNMAYLRLDKINDLINSIDKEIALYPDNYFLYYQLAMIYKDKRDLSQAKSYANKALELKPDEEKIKELLRQINNAGR